MTTEDPDDDRLRVGALAERTGLTVRTLHHWDELGLLRPSERSPSGQRWYAREDVERLYRIVALRRLGLPLGAIAAALDAPGAELAEVVRRQRAATAARLAEERRLQALLDGVLATLERGDRPGVDAVLQAIEVTEMIEQHYTPEQLERLAERREQLGEDAIRQVERDWETLFARLREARAAGTPPHDPSLRPQAERARELFAMFHGGDESIKASAGAMWKQEGPQAASRGMVDAELFAYLGEVQRAHP
jgi:DNA-binding transcriptional MerR regulator